MEIRAAVQWETGAPLVVACTTHAVLSGPAVSRLRESKLDELITTDTIPLQPEARRLEKGQDHVENIETRAQSDGVVTGKEKVRIERAQDVQSRRIFRQKHDTQTR